MEKNEVAEQINKLLDNFAGLGIETLSQEPYRGDCWKIFIKAPKDITADELQDSVQALFDSNSTKYDLKLKLLERLHNMWYEWSYARQNFQK